MMPDRESNPGPLTYESGALPIALLNPKHKAVHGSSFISTGCLKKTWTFFENDITPSFMEESLPNFLWE